LLFIYEHLVKYRASVVNSIAVMELLLMTFLHCC